MDQKKFGKLIFPAFPNLVWKLENKKKILYLSFDDGPTPGLTEAILEILAHYDVSALFFLEGRKIAENIPKLKSLNFENHKLGNHGYNHIPMILRSKQHLENEIFLTDQLIIKHFGVIPKLFRPPYGIFGPGLYRMLKTIQKDMLLWSLMANDFKWDKDKTYDYLVENLEAGDIIVFHNSEKSKKVVTAVLSRFLEYCQKNEYTFKLL